MRPASDVDRVRLRRCSCVVSGGSSNSRRARSIGRRRQLFILFAQRKLRMLAAGNFPEHRTIRDFRALHLKEFSDLFVQVVRLAREMGLVNLGAVISPCARVMTRLAARWKSA